MEGSTWRQSIATLLPGGVFQAIGGDPPTSPVPTRGVTAVGTGSIAVPHVTFAWRARVERGMAFAGWAPSTFGRAAIARHYVPVAAGRATASLAYSRRFVRRSNRSHASFVHEAPTNHSAEFAKLAVGRAYVTRASTAPHFSHDCVRRTCAGVASGRARSGAAVLVMRAPRARHRRQGDRWDRSG
jgi:hypothetical protein